MPTRKDENEIAFASIQEMIRRDEARDAARSNGKSAKAVAGKLGGLKGGPARKKALSPARRKEIALKAARTRWKKEKA